MSASWCQAEDTLSILPAMCFLYHDGTVMSEEHRGPGQRYKCIVESCIRVSSENWEPCIIFLSHSLMLCSSFESYQMLSGFSVASAACCELQVSFFISKWSCRSVSSFQGFCWAGHSQHCLQTKFWTDTGTDVKTTRSIITICKVYLRFCSKVWGGSIQINSYFFT